MSRERGVKMLTHFTPLNSALGLLQVRVSSSSDKGGIVL